VHTRPVDLRKGFDGLSGIVRAEFQADPLDGSLFLFFNRRVSAHQSQD
jgi:transposase